MSTADFNAPWMDAARAFDEGRAAEAVEKFEALLQHPSIGHNEKALIHMNLATIHDSVGAPDRVRESYDRAAEHALETYFMVQHARAQNLVNHGLNQEAIAVLEAMLASEFMTADRRASCEESVALIKKHAAAPTSQWRMT